MTQIAHLVLVRHGQSEWNQLGKWTGHTDVGLTPLGREQSRQMGRLLKDLPIQAAHTSKLKRSKHSLDELVTELGADDVPIYEVPELDERHYGELTGRRKAEVLAEHGDDLYRQLRRGWDHPIPGGETLKDVSARIIPYYQKHIEPDLKGGKGVLIVSSNHPLRALIKHLDKISDQKIIEFEVDWGEAHVYQVDRSGTVINKTIRRLSD